MTTCCDSLFVTTFYIQTILYGYFVSGFVKPSMLTSLCSVLFIHNVYSRSIITYESETFYTRKEKGTMPLRMSFPIIHSSEAKEENRKERLPRGQSQMSPVNKASGSSSRLQKEEGIKEHCIAPEEGSKHLSSEAEFYELVMSIFCSSLF